VLKGMPFTSAKKSLKMIKLIVIIIYMYSRGSGFFGFSISYSLQLMGKIILTLK
jgi:hypothetical protein